MNLSEICAGHNNNNDDGCFKVIYPTHNNIPINFFESSYVFMKDNYILTRDSGAYKLWKTSTASDVDSITFTLVDTYTITSGNTKRLNSNVFYCEDNSYNLHFYSISGDTISHITSINIGQRIRLPERRVYSFDSPTSYENDTIVAFDYVSGGGDPPYRYRRVVFTFDGTNVTRSDKSDYVELYHHESVSLYEYKPNTYYGSYSISSYELKPFLCSDTQSVVSADFIGHASDHYPRTFTSYYKNRLIGYYYVSGSDIYHTYIFEPDRLKSQRTSTTKIEPTSFTVYNYGGRFINYSDSSTNPIYFTPYDFEGGIYLKSLIKNPFLNNYRPIRANYGLIIGIGVVKLERI